MRTNEEMFAELDAFIESVGSDPSEMIAILHTAQGIFGYLPMNSPDYFAKKIEILHFIYTFYDYLFCFIKLVAGC